MFRYSLRQSEALDRLILVEKYQPPSIHRLITGEVMFERASDHLIPVGSQIDTSDVKIIHDWEENDKYVPSKYKKED